MAVAANLLGNHTASVRYRSGSNRRIDASGAKQYRRAIARRTVAATTTS
jgi:hypothetical protein